MQYAILCYHREAEVCAWSKEKDAQVMADLSKVQRKLAAQGRLGPVARLMPTSAATTLRKDRDPPLVLDGPFAETKEQLAGYTIVEAKDLDEVLAFTARHPLVRAGLSIEVRPIRVWPQRPIP